jgi:hypothetical protein
VILRDWSSDVCSSDLPKTPKPQIIHKYYNLMNLFTLINKNQEFF